MVSLNVIDNIIVGSVNNEQFGIRYTEEKFKALQQIVDKLDDVTSVDEYRELVQQFKDTAVEKGNDTRESGIPNIYISNSGNYYLMSNGVISSIAMPISLVDRIKITLDKGLDVTPLIKFWTRFLRNPKLRKLDKLSQMGFSNTVFNYVNMEYVNEEMVQDFMENKGYNEDTARKLSTITQVQITKEGLLKTFKVSKEITEKWILDENGESKQVPVIPTTKEIDPITGLITYTKDDTFTNENRIFEPAVMGQGGDAFMCSVLNKTGHIIKVGATHSITWNQIDTRDSVSCVRGLHVGGIYYIKGYQHSNTCTHNVLVSPENIGAIADDETGAMRVVEYFVLDEFSGINGSIYHSSTYGAQADAKWASDREQIIKDYGILKEDTIKEADTEVSELKSL
jgi:hypothetical protein